MMSVQLSMTKGILLPRVHDELGGMSPKSARAEMSCSENCLLVSAMLFWSTVMVFRIDLY